MVELTINEQRLSVPAGTLLLHAIRSAGVDLPTLCYHDGLAPYGACRLCMVAVTAPRPALVAACTCPAEEGLVVDTEAPPARTARRLALEFLLARCPQSPAIRDLAARHGITASRFGPPAGGNEEELCVLCGLCVRVCREAIGAAALCFVGRGQNRRVSTPFDVQSEACVGCGACAEICPTGAVRMEDRGDQRLLHTWHTTVELAKCEGCGRFFAPARLSFIQDLLPEAAQTWALCPECRTRQSAQQWIAELDRH